MCYVLFLVLRCCVSAYDKLLFSICAPRPVDSPFACKKIKGNKWKLGRADRDNVFEVGAGVTEQI